jgi:polyphenol oxidase
VPVQEKPAQLRQVVARFHDKRDGNFDIPVSDPTVTWLRQTHGAEVVVVHAAGQHRGANADAAVTKVAGAVLAVRTADCAPVLLTGIHESEVVAFGVAHAGWRGLLAGVLPAAVGALRGLGAQSVRAQLYPTIGAECYEFGAADLDALANAFGNEVRGQTVNLKPSLNMVEAVRASLARAGVTDLDLARWECTACDGDRFFSYRARQDSGRMGLLASFADPSTVQ